MKNINTIVQSNNKRLLQEPKTAQNQCNCRNKENCPLNNNCQVREIVYKAEVTSSNHMKMVYYGLAGNSFKERYGGHKNTFKYESKRHATKLAEHIWKLNDNNETWNIKWSIQAKSRKYKPGDKYCGLCLEEKRTIATSDPKSMLNSRSEIVSKCRHRKEHKLKNIKPP